MLSYAEHECFKYVKLIAGQSEEQFNGMRLYDFIKFEKQVGESRMKVYRGSGTGSAMLSWLFQNEGFKEVLVR